MYGKAGLRRSRNPYSIVIDDDDDDDDDVNAITSACFFPFFPSSPYLLFAEGFPSLSENIAAMPWCLPDRHPLYWDDMRRRFLGKGKFRVWRSAVALAGFCLVAVVLVRLAVLAMFPGGWRLPDGRAATPQGADELWMLYITLQSLCIMVFGPMAAVNIISGERERGSLELLYLTPISSRELVLQKFAAAVTLLSLVLLTFLHVDRHLLLWRRHFRAFCAGLPDAGRGARLHDFPGMFASCLIPNTRNATAVSFVVTILLAYILYFVLLPWFAMSNTAICWLIQKICYMPFFCPHLSRMPGRLHSPGQPPAQLGTGEAIPRGCREGK